jgi:hypothetical protein
MKKIYWASVITLAVFLAMAYSPLKILNIQLITATKPQVKSQVAYALKYYSAPNTNIYGNLGDVDCANFVSQTLFARGWHMTKDWQHDIVGGKQFYTRAWISSTALHDYIQDHGLAKALSWKQKDQVQVGDIVQFDWDNSGDRDHTAIVSGILDVNGSKELLLAEHSVAAYNLPIATVMALHPGPTKVYFWHLGN